jgi:hypothetical protein
MKERSVDAVGADLDARRHVVPGRLLLSDRARL